MSNKPIHITQFDLHRLQQLLEDASRTNFRGREDLAGLQAELARAEIVAPETVSHNVITMNSTVVLLE